MGSSTIGICLELWVLVVPGAVLDFAQKERIRQKPPGEVDSHQICRGREVWPLTKPSSRSNWCRTGRNLSRSAANMSSSATCCGVRTFHLSHSATKYLCTAQLCQKETVLHVWKGVDDLHVPNRADQTAQLGEVLEDRRSGLAGTDERRGRNLIWGRAALKKNTPAQCVANCTCVSPLLAPLICALYCSTLHARGLLALPRSCHGRARRRVVGQRFFSSQRCGGARRRDGAAQTSPLRCHMFLPTLLMFPSVVRA